MRRFITGRRVGGTGSSSRPGQSGFILTVATMLAVVPAFSAPAQVTFTDVSTQVGVGSDQYATNNYHSLGINWIDFNGDGWPDMFMVNGYNRKAHLYQNNGNGSFSNRDDLLPAALKNLNTYDMGGSIFADYDNDGDDDIYIYTDYATASLTESFKLYGPNEPSGPPNLLLKNLWVENGNQESVPLFTDVAVAAGVDDYPTEPSEVNGALAGRRTMTAGWLDYNRDGCLDLYLGHWVLQADQEDNEKGVGNGFGDSIWNKQRLFRNKCNGTFEDVTVSTGVNAETDPDSTYHRATLAFIGADLDNDLWPDLYAVNVHNAPAPLSYDVLYRNEGDGTFSDITGDSPGIGNDAGAGMGIDVADIDLDGDWDVYISDILESENMNTDVAPFGNVLYINQMSQNGGLLKFNDNSIVESGVKGDFSWGVSFFDLDHDGDEDLWVSTIVAKPKFLYINNGPAGGSSAVTFTNAAGSAGMNVTSRNYRGSSTADYDGDGDLDLAVINQGGTLQLFRNDSAKSGNWLQVKLVPNPAVSVGGKKTNRDAIGSRVEVVRTGKPNLMRQVKGGSSAHSQDSLVQHFGLGNVGAVEEIHIYWPSGAEDVLCNRAANEKYEILEGSAPVGNCDGDSTVPTAPGSLEATVAGTSGVDLSWTASSDAVGVVGYTVYRNDQPVANRVGLTHAERGLNLGAQLCYTVTALDAAGNESAASNEVCTEAVNDTTPPAAPGNLAATVVDGRTVELTWQIPLDDLGVDKYRIFRNGPQVAEVSALASPPYEDAGLSPDVNYCYTVRALDAAGNQSVPSNQSCATPVDSKQPEPPTHLVADNVGSTTVELTWEGTTDDVGVVGYRVYRGAIEAGETVETTFTDTDLSPETDYSYTVTAVDASGKESFPSSPYAVTTAAGNGGGGGGGGDGGGGGGGGGCFIATAAYGSPMEPQVVLLREFRDRYLEPYGLGRKFIEIYYVYSPSVAEVIRDYEGLRATARFLLWPWVALAWIFVAASVGVKAGIGTGLLFLTGAWFVYGRPGRKSRNLQQED